MFNFSYRFFFNFSLRILLNFSSLFWSYLLFDIDFHLIIIFDHYFLWLNFLSIFLASSLITDQSFSIISQGQSFQAQFRFIYLSSFPNSQFSLFFQTIFQFFFIPVQFRFIFALFRSLQFFPSIEINFVSLKNVKNVHLLNLYLLFLS